MMTFWSILGIAIGLGADAMSVSAAIGIKWNGPGQKFRLAWSMGLFQFLMPMIGWLVGQSLAGMLHHVGMYLAAALVFAVGVKISNVPFYPFRRDNRSRMKSSRFFALTESEDMVK